MHTCNPILVYMANSRPARAIYQDPVTLIPQDRKKDGWKEGKTRQPDRQAVRQKKGREGRKKGRREGEREIKKRKRREEGRKGGRRGPSRREGLPAELSHHCTESLVWDLMSFLLHPLPKRTPVGKKIP